MEIKTHSKHLFFIGALLIANGALSTTGHAQEKAKATEKKVTIENEFLRVGVEDNGKFSLTALPLEKTIASGQLQGVAGAFKVSEVSDETFGRGRFLTNAGGSIGLFPHLPFALLRLNLRNDTSESQTINRLPLATLTVDWQDADNLKTLGTGGLLNADRNPGSYAWLAVAEPQSRNGLVAGWLTHDRGSGVLFSKIADGKVQLEARSDYGKLRLVPKQKTGSEILALGYFSDARLGLEAWADAVAQVYKIRLPEQPVGYCTWYADKHGGASDEEHLAQIGEYAKANLKAFGFDFVQIDDGWQSGDAKGNGPKKNFSQYNENGPYKSGMRATSDALRAQGITPGLWFMPFAGTYNDPWFADKQDLFVKHSDGKPYDTSWGGSSLDMTNPAAQKYVADIARRISKEWAYKYFKMDGLYTGIGVKQVYVNSGYKEDDFGDAVFFNTSKTNIEAFRDGLKLVRNAAGRDVFFLGCTMTQNMRSFGGSIGLVDAMRIGPDNNGTWKGWAGASPVFGSRYYFLNNRIWYNDPDPFYLRAGIPIEEARTIASWPTIAGQLNSSSDWLPDFSPERLDILRRTMPSHHATTRPVDFFESELPRIWQVTDASGGPRRDVLALYNWNNEPSDMNVYLARCGLSSSKQYVAFDFWANAFVAPFQSNLLSTVAPHGCRILAVRALEDHPILLSTSRHITQGITDVKSEQWNEGKSTVFGQSEVVANDPYELRLYAPQGWTAQSAGDGKISQDGTGVRVTIKPTKTGALNWKVVFVKE